MNNKCQYCDNDCEWYVKDIPYCEIHFRQKEKEDFKETENKTIGATQMIFLADEIRKRTGLITGVSESLKKLTSKEYRKVLSVMYRKPHFFKGYLLKNIINHNPF